MLKISNADKVFIAELDKGHRFVLGRGDNHEAGQVSDAKVSSKHCVFTLTQDYLKITDTDSKNGTYLNGIRIEDAEMFVGDEVKIGDTIIKLDEGRMDQESIDELTFPGPAKNRISHELRVDFTGARIQNQLYSHAHPEPHSINTPSQVKEIDLRKKAKTKIRLSKQEIKFRHQKLSKRARMVDTFLLVLVFVAPIFYIINASYADGIPLLGLTAEGVAKHKANLIGGSTLLFTGFFLTLNMRYMAFTFGEKLLGLETIYENQD